MAYAWLLFDADGTLFDFERTEAAALQATFTDFGIAHDERNTAVYHAINRVLWQQLERGELRADVLRVLRFERLFEALSVAGDPEIASDRYVGHLSEGTYLLEGAEVLVTALARTHRLAIITNGLSAVQRPRFAASTIGHLFDPIVVSDELGVAKPDPAIFDATFERMGQPAKDEVLLIGDSLSSDICGGARYGIDTCWFNPRRAPAPADLAITHEIDALASLPSRLG